MAPQGSLSDLLLGLAHTGPGALILSGLLVGFLVFLLPLLLPEAHGWREAEKQVVVFDWGISIACLLLGLGIAMLELQGPGLAPFYSLRYRFGLSGFFLAMAGHRVYRRIAA